VLDVSLGPKKDLSYLVSWEGKLFLTVGFGNNDNTWEPIENLANASDAIFKFHKDLNNNNRPKKSISPVKKAVPVKKSKTKAQVSHQKSKPSKKKDVAEYVIDSIIGHKKKV
jgi:hypothetical protein